MKLQCTFCKHICCNPEYDEMLDCELDLEEDGTSKCYTNNFNKFELETDEKVCQSYLKAFNEEYGLYERLAIRNSLTEANEIIMSFYSTFRCFTMGTQKWKDLMDKTERFLFYGKENINDRKTTETCKLDSEQNRSKI